MQVLNWFQRINGEMQCSVNDCLTADTDLWHSDTAVGPVEMLITSARAPQLNSDLILSNSFEATIKFV